MANAGFSAVTNYFGTIAGLTAKSSDSNTQSQLAEAQDSNGDTAAHDVYGETTSPSVEYVVTADIANTTALVTLGSIHTIGTGDNAKKIMLTSCAIKTAAGQMPTVALSGVQVESGATASRTYAVNVAIAARAKAQDVAGAFTTSTKFTSIDTTFSIDANIATIAGTPIASSCSHGKVEVSATMTDGDGTGTITAASSGDFKVSAISESAPDAGYITRTATAFKFLTGADVSASA